MHDTTDIKNARTDHSLIERAVVDAGADIRDPTKFRCPFHDDANPSAGIFQGNDGGWRFKCHACDASGDVFDIVQRSQAVEFSEARDVVLSWNGSTATRKSSKNGRTRKAVPTFATPEDAIQAMLTTPKLKGGRHTATWTYKNRDSSVSFQVARFDFADGHKDFRPLHPVGDKWAIGDPAGKLPLYRHPEVRRAKRADKPIYVLEGEKAADAAVSIGLCATTSAHGSSSAAKTDWTPLSGADVVLLPDADEPGEQYATDVTAILTTLPDPARVKIVHLPNLPAAGDLVDLIARLDSRDDVEIRHGIEEQVAAAEYVKPKETELQELITVKLSEVTPALQPYLWPGRIPSASCTLIGGPQGATKNLFIYDLIARVTTGSPWTDDPAGPRRTPQNVILLEAEEHLESSIVTRLAAAGADLDRVVYVKGAPTQDPDRTRLISIQRDADGITRKARQIGNVGLVVVSPITSYLGCVEQNSNEQVRNEIIYPLKILSEVLGCAVVILKHPNKDWRNADPLGRIGGSAAWTEAMRCVVFIGEDPDEDDDEKNPRRCAHWIKFSIGPTPDPLSWKIRIADSGAPSIYYLADPITFSAAEMLVGRRKTEERKSKRELAAEWIAATLEHGPKTAANLKDAAMTAVDQDRRFSMDAFERARKDMRDANRLAFERRPETNPAEWWYWLADQSAPDWYERNEDTGATSELPHATLVSQHAEVAEHEQVSGAESLRHR